MKMNKQEEKQYHIKDPFNHTLLMKMKIEKFMKSLLISLSVHCQCTPEEWG
jgi:hypothetical protein